MPFDSPTRYHAAASPFLLPVATSHCDQDPLPTVIPTLAAPAVWEEGFLLSRAGVCDLQVVSETAADVSEAAREVIGWHGLPLWVVLHGH